MHNKYILAVLGIVGIVALLIWAGVFRSENFVGDPEKVQVAASFYPLYFFAHEIGGEYAEVSLITPPGAEPHEYEPTAQNIARIYKSDLLLVNGSGLEPWLSNIEKNILPDRTKVVIAGEGLATRRIIEEGEETIDPHVWLSPRLAQEMVEKIAQGFIEVDPEHTSFYRTQTEALRTRLHILHSEYEKELAQCSQKFVVTSHVAFGYLAAEYGFEQVAVTGVSPESEPSPQELVKVADFVRKHNIKYIFFESLVSPKLAETLAKEVGAETLVLNPLEGLTQKEIEAGGDYFTEMRNNLNQLKIALECQV